MMMAQTIKWIMIENLSYSLSLASDVENLLKRDKMKDRNHKIGAEINQPKKNSMHKEKDILAPRSEDFLLCCGYLLETLPVEPLEL